MNEPMRQKTNPGFQSGLRDILLEVIAPALIMLMLGSMFFFLVEILYRDNYQFAVHWVFGWYVFAIVLIGRISIIEGFLRAQFFAAALMLAVFVHTGIGPHWVLIILTWWAASKLAWDCTFIDESRDVTGQGLVSVALDRWKIFRDKFLQVWRGKISLADAIEPEQPPDSNPNWAEAPTASVSRWMKELVWKRKRQNTPGIWTFFFFVAGLFVFGFGQLFIEASQRARTFSLRMFALYLFAGLGLMMFISLVGLFRYLKQRGTEMPDSIARAWLVVGTIFAIGLVGVVLFIPWPNTGLSLSSLIPKFETVKRTGENSPLTERGKVEGPRGNGKPAERGAAGQGNTASNQQGKGGIPGGDKVGDLPKGNPGSSSGGNQPGGKSPKPAQSNEQPSPSNSPTEKSKVGKPASPSPGTQPKDNSTKSNEAPPNVPKQVPPKNSGEPKNSEPQKSDSPNQPNNSSQSNPSQPTETRPAEKSPDQSTAEQNSSPSEKTKSGTTQPSPNPNPPLSTSWLQNIMSTVKAIISILIWIIALVIGVFLFVRYRNEIIDGLTNFFKSLRLFLARLFQGKQPAESAEALAAKAKQQVEYQRFAAFRNPFEDPQKAKSSPSELVEYTFAAFESLAREAKIPRQTDETPIEFARRVAIHLERLGQGARQLAEMYCQVAYADVQLSANDIQPLRGFWAQMQSFEQRISSPQSVAVD